MDGFEDKKIWKQPKFFFGIGGLVVAALVILVFLQFSDRDHLLSNFSASIFETFGDVFGLKRQNLLFEVNLDDGSVVGLAAEDRKSFDTSSENEKLELQGGGIPENSVNSISKAKGVGGVDEKKDLKKKTTSQESSSSQILGKPKQILLASSSVQTVPGNKIQDCDFSSSGSPAGGLNRKVIFNELAWMGGLTSASDEWMELKNNSSGEINLSDWQIKNQDASVKIVLGSGEKVLAGGLFLLERTDDTSAPQVSADKIYVGAISNSGEWLKLFDSSCGLVDEIDTRGGWNILGGDNETKKTLERNNSDFGWHTSVMPGGTPRAKNSEPVVQTPPSTPPPSEPPPPSSPPQEQPTSTATSTPPSEPPPPPPQNRSEPKILISEVMAGSSASSDDEFIEIYNYGSQAVDLTGWSIKKKSSSGAESSLVVASRLSGKTIPAGKYLLLAHDGGYTGTVSADVTWPASYSLAYTNNVVTIYSASGGVIDQVSWAEIPKDKSYTRSSLDVLAGFSVSESPSPQNSGM